MATLNEHLASVERDLEEWQKRRGQATQRVIWLEGQRALLVNLLKDGASDEDENAPQPLHARAAGGNG
jgi:hypothetical protein